MNSLTVPRSPGEAAGAICKLVPTKEGLRPLVINVEYNQLDALLQTSAAGGDKADASGFSPFPGNVNTLVMKLEPYAACHPIPTAAFAASSASTTSFHHRLLSASTTSTSPSPSHRLLAAPPPRRYANALAATGGTMPEFVNPKYANEERTVFKKPTRLECMMQAPRHPSHLAPHLVPSFRSCCGVPPQPDARPNRTPPPAA